MSADKTLYNFNEISEIILTDPICGELSLEKVTDDKLEEKKKYQEVFISDLSLMTGIVSQTAMQVANQSMTLSQIANQAPNGLFAATANPANLSKFANGTTTTMLRDTSGHLIEHAGFVEVRLRASLNPAIILSVGMQAVLAISGTYYVHEIDTQIKALNAKLEEILKMEHDTDIGRLIAIRKGLYEIADRESINTTDLTAIRTYKSTASEIHEKFMFRSKRIESELDSKIGEKNEEQRLQYINLRMKIALEANKLALYAELVEIGSRIKIGDQLETINALIKQLKLNYANSFYHNSDLEIEKIYSERLQRINNELVEKNKELESSLEEFNALYNKGWGQIRPGIEMVNTLWNSNKAKGKRKLEKKYLSTLKTDIEQHKESDRIDNMIDKIVKLPHKETEILYVPIGNNKQRLFVLIEDE